MTDLEQWLKGRLSRREKNRILQRFPQKSGMELFSSGIHKSHIFQTLERLISETAESGRRLILYFAPHPYCLASTGFEACGFCTFPHERFTSKAEISQSIETVIQETSLYEGLLSKIPVDAVYFGGGTANLMGREDLRYFLQFLTASFNITPGAEITYEGMPSLFRPEVLETFAQELSSYDLRISMGVQSFDRRLLSLMGRVWQLEESPQKSVRAAQRLGIRSNLDLIFNLPQQSPSDICEDVDQVADLKPEHVTFFDLVVGEGVNSPWSESAEILARLPDAEACYQNWRMVTERLAGYGYRRVSKSDYVLEKAGERGHYVYEKLWKSPETHTLIGLGYEGMSVVLAPDLKSGLKLINHRDPWAYAQDVKSGAIPAYRVFEYTPVDALLYHLTAQCEAGRVDFSAYRQLFGVELQKVFRDEIQLLGLFGLARCDSSQMILTEYGVFHVDTIQSLFCRSRVEELKALDARPLTQITSLPNIH